MNNNEKRTYYKRKKILIDKKFQLKQTLSVMGLTVFFIAVIISIFGVQASLNNHKLEEMTGENVKIDGNLYNLMGKEDDIVHALMTLAQNSKAEKNKTSIKDIVKEHFGNIKAIKNNIAEINKIIRNTNFVLISCIAVMIIQCIIFFYIMIRKTHKLSGPIFVMSRYMNDIIEGKQPDLRSLRKHDELQDFYELFTRLVEVIKEREHK